MPFNGEFLVVCLQNAVHFTLCCAFVQSDQRDNIFFSQNGSKYKAHNGDSFINSLSQCGGCRLISRTICNKNFTIVQWRNIKKSFCFIAPHFSEILNNRKQCLVSPFWIRIQPHLSLRIKSTTFGFIWQQFRIKNSPNAN